VLEKDDDPNLFKGYGLEIKIPEVDSGEFLKIRETLTRIGIADQPNKTLYQSCHILHKRKRYVIIHYKELRAFDGKEMTITDEDIARRNTIIALLVKWNLVNLFNSEAKLEPILEDGVDVIPFKEKSKWKLIPKYQMGGRPVHTRKTV
jgi:hypothetical protein